ncbi:MAG: helix-turn-helix domain-containing protein [Actinomycetota bacterium]
MTSLRERNRRRAMRETQRAALAMFEARGFDDVTVAEIAADVGIAASTIYRHFETKEAIVLWDEHDDGIDEGLARELGHQPPFAAMRAAFVADLGARYDEDLDFQLRRVRYIYETEQLHAASVETEYRQTLDLADALEPLLSERDRGNGPLLAGAAMLALDVAFDRWQASRAARPLGEIIGEAFDTLERLGSIR